MRSILTSLAVLAVLSWPSPAASQATAGRAKATPPKSAARTGYGNVNGLRLYYEVHGPKRAATPPLVMLHGAMSTAHGDFGKLVPTLMKSRQVIMIEQQAHGHTADIGRPLTYAQMGEDTAELLRQLGITTADFFGYSMGGGIALEIAMRRPALVRKIVFAGGPVYHPEGFYPELLKMEETMKGEDMVGSPWQLAYAKVAPDPAGWNALVAKVRDLDLAWKGFSEDKLRALQAPTLLIAGDADVTRPEHIAQMFRLMGGGVPGDLAPLPRTRLAIYPGTTHVTVMQRTSWLLPMIGEFLDAPMPESR